jgi:hypothetical protein
MKSNYSYVNGIEIVGGVSARKVTRIKSPTNAVGNEFKDGTSVELMVGGKNSTKAQKIIRGGQDSV